MRDDTEVADVLELQMGSWIFFREARGGDGRNITGEGGKPPYPGTKNYELPAASYKLPASSQEQRDLNIDWKFTETLE
jgi:hypothetical protein